MIALQINNQNEANKIRAKELIYLNSIKEDLQLNISNLEEFYRKREATVHSVNILLEYFEEKREIELNSFNLNNIGVLNWYPFVQHSNTYQELMNSGNFAILSNRSIKNELQNIQSKYESIAFIESEMQQDYERYLYDPFFKLVDLNTVLNNYSNQLNTANNESIEEIDKNEIDRLLKIKLYKNGLVLARYNSSQLMSVYSDLIESSKQLIDVIEIESDKDL